MAANHRYFTFEAPLICQRLPGTTVKDDRSISDPYLKFPYLKFIYSEKATKFCKNSTEDLSYVVPVKSIVEISQNFMAFSEYLNFTTVGF
jgi:hypothetical protein